MQPDALEPGAPQGVVEALGEIGAVERLPEAVRKHQIIVALEA
jgi:hypothetical protein